MEVLPPDSDYQEPDNTNPYLLPTPVSQIIEYGSETQEYFLGEIHDNESHNQTITITVDIDSGAEKFVEWRRSSNNLIIRG